jgi:hypothetical protein
MIHIASVRDKNAHFQDSRRGFVTNISHIIVIKYILYIIYIYIYIKHTHHCTCKVGCLIQPFFSERSFDVKELFKDLKGERGSCI